MSGGKMFSDLENYLLMHFILISIGKISKNYLIAAFFDINELVCLKMENRRVFNATHQFIFDLIEKNG